MDSDYRILCMAGLFDGNGSVAGRRVSLVVRKSSLAPNSLERLIGFFAGRGSMPDVLDVSEVLSERMPAAVFDGVVSGVVGEILPCDLALIKAFAKVLVPGGALTLKTQFGNEERVARLMKKCGFRDVVPKARPGIVLGRTNFVPADAYTKVKVNTDKKEKDKSLKKNDLKKTDSSSLGAAGIANAPQKDSLELAKELEEILLKELIRPNTSNAMSSENADTYNKVKLNSGKKEMDKMFESGDFKIPEMSMFEAAELAKAFKNDSLELAKELEKMLMKELSIPNTSNAMSSENSRRGDDDRRGPEGDKTALKPDKKLQSAGSSKKNKK